MICGLDELEGFTFSKWKKSSFPQRFSLMTKKSHISGIMDSWQHKGQNRK